MADFVEKIPVKYANAANNQDVTYVYGIQRVQTNVTIQNSTGGGPSSTGQEPTNKDKDNFSSLQKKFLNELSYSKPLGTIHCTQGNHWRIDQQENMMDRYNIQYQVGSKNFANVVVNTVIQPACGVDMNMRVFAQRQGMVAKHAKPIRTVDDVDQMSAPIKLNERINKYVGEALRVSLYKKLKCEINVLILEQRLG